MVPSVEPIYDSIDSTGVKERRDNISSTHNIESKFHRC